MSFFKNIFDGAKSIINNQLSSEILYEKDKGIVSDTGNKPRILESGKDFFLPGRGFSDEEIKAAEPKLKDRAIGLAKTGGEIAAGISFLSRRGLDLIPGVDFDEQKIAENKILKGMTEPSNPEEAKVMRFLDVAGFAPVGSIKHLGKADDVAKLANKSQKVSRGAPPVKPPAPGKASDIKLPPGQAERRFSKRVRESMPDANMEPQIFKQRNTKELSQRAKNLIKDNPQAAEKLALTDNSDKGIATASELLNKYRKEAEAAKDATMKNALYDKAADLANDVAARLTEQGRSIQAASLYGKLTPEGQARFAARSIQKWNKNNPTKQIAELTGEQTKYISESMRKINKMPDSTQKAQRLFELQNYIQDLTPTPFIKKLTNVWKAGLLTGVKTSGLNIGSNTGHFASEFIKDMPAAAVDTAASLFTGKRTKTLTARKAFEGIKEGTVKGGRYFWTGFDERNIGQKLDYRRVNFGKGKVAKAFQTYSDTVFRTIGAQDQPYYYASLSRSLMDQALAKGKTQGLKGKKLVKFAEDLVQNPTEEMIRYGTLDAKTAVFQNKTALGEAAKRIQNIPGIGQFVVPFAQTPSAVAMQIINYSPAGAVKTILENIGKGKFDQRMFSQGIGRSIVGTAPLVIGAELYKNGMVSLDYPAGDERQIELDKAQGKKYNAIKFSKDGDWRQAIVLGPAGNLVLMGAYFQKALEEVGSPAEAMVTAGLGMMNSFTEQTFLTGLSNFTNAVSDPERYAKQYLPNLAASFIPTIVSDTARAGDEFERESKGETFLDTFRTRALNRTPGLRENLPRQVDALGNEVRRGGNTIETMLDPTRPSEDRSTELTKELERLMLEGYRAAPTKIGPSAGYESLTKEEEERLYEVTGGLVNDKLTKLIQNEKYQKMSDEKRNEIIRKFTQKAQIEGRARFILAQTDGLTKDEVKLLLGGYKEDGLLTQQVFKEFKRLRKGE